MCFDIDVIKLTMEELHDTLFRISLVLSRPTILNNLPDNGHQLRQVKLKLEGEIKFREGLDKTRQQVVKKGIKSASDSNLFSLHTAKVCSVEKKPERERFRPHLTTRSNPSGLTESSHELHSGTQLLDLLTSLSLQVNQEERLKEEQMKVKQDRLLAFLKTNIPDDSDSEETPAWVYSDDVSDNEDHLEEDQANIVCREDEPGPSGLCRLRKPKRELTEEKGVVEEEEDIEERKQEPRQLFVRKTVALKPEYEPGSTMEMSERTDKSIELEELKTKNEEEEIELNADDTEQIAQLLVLRKEASDPKNQDDDA